MLDHGADGVGARVGVDAKLVVRGVVGVGVRDVLVGHDRCGAGALRGREGLREELRERHVVARLRLRPATEV